VSGDCVKDNLTGLTWMMTPPSATYTWQNALTYANGRNAANLCGYNSEWRLPNILELESIINLGQAGSASWLTRPENGFVGIAGNKYWSSTTASSATEKAWVIDFSDNGRDIVNKSSLYLSFPVRGTTTSPAQPWRTGQTECYNASGNIVSCADTGQDGGIQAGASWPSPRFLDLGNETVKDNLTGLIWSANANTPGSPACTPGVAKISYDSYLYIQCLNNNSYLGYNDWRVPNRKELQSLIDHSRYNPAVPSGHPSTGVVSGTYWSSDTYINQCNLGWAIDMDTGLVSESYKDPFNALHVWPVRGPLSLKALLAGEGVGSVTGDGISCNGYKCLGVYNSGEEITITAESSPDSVFAGWTGCPSPPSGSECNILMDADITVTATFLAAKSIWEKPASLNFGKVGLGVVSPQKYVSIKNLNDTNLQIETIVITSTNATEFSFDEDCSAVPLSPGGTCSIALMVNAQDYGTRRAELVVTSNDTKVPIVKMKLKAKAMPAKIFIQPKTLRFGEVSTVDSAKQQLTIENRGPTPLSISTITLTGDHMGDFTIDPTDCPVLQEGQASILTVTFGPEGIGKRTGTLMITPDVPKKGPVKVMLKGEGT
jgi:hypothetical protein